MSNKKKLENDLTFVSGEKEEGLWGQSDLNISYAIEFLQKQGFRDVTQKMLRDLDPVIDPPKKDSGYRSFNKNALNKAKIVLTLKAFGFSNTKIAHMFNLRAEMLSFINGHFDTNTIVVKAEDDKNVLAFKKMANEYRGILLEIKSRAADMHAMANIGIDFFNDEDERLSNMVE